MVVLGLEGKLRYYFSVFVNDDSPVEKWPQRGSQASSDTNHQTSNSLVFIPISCLPNIFIINSLFKKLVIESLLIYVSFPVLVRLWVTGPKGHFSCLFCIGQYNCLNILHSNYFCHPFPPPFAAV